MTISTVGRAVEQHIYGDPILSELHGRITGHAIVDAAAGRISTRVVHWTLR